jgi:hypothetical protein
MATPTSKNSQTPSKTPNTQISAGSFWRTRRLISARVNEYALISKFTNGYRNREDKTNLPAGVLIEGSQNVLTNVSERIQSRPGYVLDGPGGTQNTGISSAFTFNNHIGNEINVRTYSPTPTTGVMEYRYVAADGTVTWRTLLSSLTSTTFNYASWWYPLLSGGSAGEGMNVVLMVNGTANIYEWSGAVTTIASVGTNTLTKGGTLAWSQTGFYSDTTQHPTRKVTINGIDYTYTGGENTTTLTGVTPDPASASPAIVAGAIVHQTPIITNRSGLTSMELGTFDLIEVFNTQLFIGNLQNQLVQASKSWTIGNGVYTDFTESSIGQSGYGHKLALDSPPVSINALENSIDISAGKNQWYQISVAVSTYTDTTSPASPIVYNVDNWTVNRLKTTAAQAAQSQAMVSAMKNDLIFISNEPTLDRLGRVEQILGTTQTTNISDPIKLDFDFYNFTNSAIYYNKYFIYVAIPQEGLVRIFNIVKNYWEAPQTIPVSRFYTVGGTLYGHSSLTNESYELFTGNTDNGNAINAIAVFSYQFYGSRTILKQFNKFYVEGYIQSNTTLTLGINYELDGCQTQTSYNIVGTDKAIVCIPVDTSSLGKSPLGKNPLGGNLNSAMPLPPHFQVIKTFPRKDFLLVSYTLSSSSPDQNWQVVSFGPSLDYSTNIPISITE